MSGSFPQILRGDGADGEFYRGRVFLGTDGAPVTLQVRFRSYSHRLRLVGASSCKEHPKHSSCEPLRAQPVRETSVKPQEMMDAVHASGAYEGRAALTGQPGTSKGKLVCNARTRQVKAIGTVASLKLFFLVATHARGCTCHGWSSLQCGVLRRTHALRAVQTLGWQAKYSSFDEFMAAGADDWFRANPEGAAVGAKHQ